MNTALTQVAFVTGASSGMGKETALRLLDKGLIVYVAARRLELMTDLQERGAAARDLGRAAARARRHRRTLARGACARAGGGQRIGLVS